MPVRTLGGAWVNQAPSTDRPIGVALGAEWRTSRDSLLLLLGLRHSMDMQIERLAVA